MAHQMSNSSLADLQSMTAAQPLEALQDTKNSQLLKTCVSFDALYVNLPAQHPTISAGLL